jgi:hypothetical protein
VSASSSDNLSTDGVYRSVACRAHNKCGHALVVTVEGMNVSMNVSVEEALTLKILNSRRASYEVNVQGGGATFNSTFLEVTRGAVAVDSPGIFEAYKRFASDSCAAY